MAETSYQMGRLVDVLASRLFEGGMFELAEELADV